MTGWQVVGRIALLCSLAAGMIALAIASFWLTFLLIFAVLL